MIMKLFGMIGTIRKGMLVLMLLLAPLGTGLFINRFLAPDNRSVGVTYISGFLILLAAFQLMTVPVIFLDAWGFDIVVKLFTVIVTLFTGLGIMQSFHLWRKEGMVFRKRILFKDRARVEQVQWIVMLVLLGVQLFMAVTHASFDGDDAYYVANSLVTEEAGTLYRTSPYTGRSTFLDKRHSLAAFPIWIAYIARMTGIHATILSHTILPLVLIPLTYLIYYEIGKKLLKDKLETLPTYMIFVNILQIFGNESIYSNSTFLLIRTWQGKSMLANVVIPAIFMILLWMFEENGQNSKEKGGLWILLVVVNIVAAMMSTASVFLNSFLLAVMGIIISMQEKNWKILLKMALCCIPCVVYAVLYMAF